MTDEHAELWINFRKNKFLWLVNSLLHIFGYAIVFEFDTKDKLVAVYPKRVQYRGFSEKCNTEGYIAISKYMVENGEQLLKESKEQTNKTEENKNELMYFQRERNELGADYFAYQGYHPRKNDEVP